MVVVHAAVAVGGAGDVGYHGGVAFSRLVPLVSDLHFLRRAFLRLGDERLFHGLVRGQGGGLVRPQAHAHDGRGQGRGAADAYADLGVPRERLPTLLGRGRFRLRLGSLDHFGVAYDLGLFQPDVFAFFAHLVSLSDMRLSVSAVSVTRLAVPKP